MATTAGLAVLLPGVMATFAIGIYSGGWHGTMSRWAAGMFPFPAAIVDGRPVWVRDVLADTDAFAAYREAHPEVQGVDLSREQIQSNVLSRLVQEAWFEQVAAQRGITVTDAEVEAEFAAAKQDGSELQDILAQFGWSEAEFK
ncbi:MAG: SurA N-terminal domain-containing protein, partial [bacterium]